MKQLSAAILENKKITPWHYRMRVESAYFGRETKPGQFVEVRCSDGFEPLLRRPLSVHRIAKGGIELLYEVVGQGTELLSRKKRGDLLDVIGPLGTGFSLRKTKDERRTIILMAGGIGVAPLVALAEKLTRGKTTVIIGARTKSHILCEADFKKLGCKVLVSTDDGSKGRHGFATDVLRDFLRTTNDERERSEAEPPRKGRTTIYACGPTPMLKAVADIARARQIHCQVSLEERMACGVGVCLGCPVRVRKTFTEDERRTTNDEYKMVCKDGPVFNAEEIKW